MSYLDSRGVAMDDMSFSEALERMHALAGTNLPDEHDIARDAALVEERAWQLEALNTLVDTLVNHCDAIDEAFTPPKEYGEWPAEATRPDRSDDPSSPVFAIRIASQMARNAQPDPMTVHGVEAADAFDLDNQALEMTEDFLVLHGEKLDETIRVVRLPSVN